MDAVLRAQIYGDGDEHRFSGEDLDPQWKLTSRSRTATRLFRGKIYDSPGGFFPSSTKSFVLLWIACTCNYEILRQFVWQLKPTQLTLEFPKRNKIIVSTMAGTNSMPSESSPNLSMTRPNRLFIKKPAVNVPTWGMNVFFATVVLVKSGGVVKNPTIGGIERRRFCCLYFCKNEDKDIADYAQWRRQPPLPLCQCSKIKLAFLFSDASGRHDLLFLRADLFLSLEKWKKYNTWCNGIWFTAIVISFQINMWRLLELFLFCRPPKSPWLQFRKKPTPENSYFSYSI